MRRLLYRFACWLKERTEHERIHWCRDLPPEAVASGLRGYEHGVGLSGPYTFTAYEPRMTVARSLYRGQSCPSCGERFA